MKSLVLLTLAASTATATVALAQEQGRVLSVTPVAQQVAVPQQVCRDESVYTGSNTSGAGAVLGALAGGVVGNAIGHGGGRAAATAAGVIGGAMLGNQAEASGQPQYQTVRNCTTQTYYQNRTVAYDVVYEYAGRNYTTRTTTPPGDWIPLSVQPAATASNGYYGSNQVPQGAYSTVPVQPPVVYENNYYGGGYYAPQPVYSGADYVAPVVIGAALAAGVYYASRPHYGGWRGGGYHRPGWRR
ncbi:MAG: glycine zipper 2TM domain-containing protein [Burkholderiaceae bacterium]|jgi:uncharacterized protein YcfJ|nr:glycine zipper 2TM domain-containing protein [Burkholderiaceae bacterium]